VTCALEQALASLPPSPPEELPLEEPPPEELPLEELPSEELPLEELPSEELPSEELPLEELPSEELPSEELPLEEVPLEEPSPDELPLDNPPPEELLPPPSNIPLVSGAAPPEHAVVHRIPTKHACSNRRRDARVLRGPEPIPETDLPRRPEAFRRTTSTMSKAGQIACRALSAAAPACVLLAVVCECHIPTASRFARTERHCAQTAHGSIRMAASLRFTNSPGGSLPILRDAPQVPTSRDPDATRCSRPVA
jgi:hypothetical protein